MNIATLCDKIELQPYIKERVLLFAEEFDFEAVDELQKGYLIYEDMKDALNCTRAVLDEDTDSIKILACMLKESLDTYKAYQDKGISDDIYFATMKCFTRFIDETYKMTGRWCFDRYWWTTRQVALYVMHMEKSYKKYCKVK